MSKITDNLIAYRILRKLITPFNQTAAFKLGIIDGKGKALKKASELKTQDEQEAFTYLDRLVFNVKRIVNRLPGGESRLKNLTTALFLIKESMQADSIVSLKEDADIDAQMIEAEYAVVDFLEMLSETLSEEVTAGAVGAGPTNKTGAAISSDTPVVRKKKMKSVSVGKDVIDAAKSGRRIIEMLPEEVQTFIAENEDTLIVLRNEKILLAIGE